MSDTGSGTQVRLPSRTYFIEFFVGLFALLGCASFGYLAINIAGMKLTNAGYYKIAAEFTNIAGLKKGAPVEIAGVQIGEVSSIELKDTDALLTIQVKNGVALRADDIASIRTKGIIGDKYIKISPGASDKAIGPDGELMKTESAVELEDILGKFIHKMENE